MPSRTTRATRTGRARPAPKLGFSSTPPAWQDSWQRWRVPHEPGGRSAPEKSPTVPTSAVAITEDVTPLAPCRTRPHGRAEGSASCFIHRVSTPGGAALELAHAGQVAPQLAIGRRDPGGQSIRPPAPPGEPRPVASGMTPLRAHAPARRRTRETCIAVQDVPVRVVCPAAFSRAAIWRRLSPSARQRPMSSTRSA